MPIVNGTMYPEAREQLRENNELKVLILGNDTQEISVFTVQLNTLHVYINSLGSNVRISLYATPDFDSETARRTGITILSQAASEADLVEIVRANDIDVVYDQESSLRKRFTQDNFYIFQTTKTISELTMSCEDFLVGNEIPWLFSNITWNLPLLMRYFDRPSLCKEYFAFMGECTSTKRYTANQQDKLRYIANRLSHIEYSKDIIQSYIKRMRKTERNGYSDQDYNLELNYHLSNYYFLIAGVLDSMARFLNDLYKLKLPRRHLALEKVDFVNAHRRKRTGYVRILTRKDFTEWVGFLKERRNFIAHDGDMRQSPLVVQKDNLLTDDEVEQLVNQQSDWVFMATLLPQATVDALRNQAAQMVRIQNDYRTVAKNVMFVPDDNGGHKLYQPLPSIDYDYNKLNAVLTRILEKLKAS